MARFAQFDEQVEYQNKYDYAHQRYLHTLPLALLLFLIDAVGTLDFYWLVYKGLHP